MLVFDLPLIAGNLLQQCGGIADTLAVGRLLGQHALSAVSSSLPLMMLLTSVILGLCMGSGALFSIQFGECNEKGLAASLTAAFVLIAVCTAAPTDGSLSS